MAESCPTLMLQLIARIEQLERQMAEMDADIQELYAQAQAKGYDGRIVRRMIKLRRIGKGPQPDDISLRALYREAVDIGVLESWF